MVIGRENLRHDIGEVVAGGNENKRDDTIGYLLPEPSHLYAEVAIAASNNVVVNHGDTGLIVLVQDGRLMLWEA